MTFDYKNPDYPAIYAERAERLKRIRANPQSIPALKLYYRDNIAQFLTDWACTVDPRGPEIGQPSVIPFILFPKQIEWVDWFIAKWKNREPGLTDKSRDMGLSWLAVCTAASVCMFNDGIVAGFGSRKEDYVDKIGDPKSLFWKAREFLRLLPNEFTGAWSDAHMRISFSGTGSVMTGEAGDNIGRGDRTSFYFVDEAAHIERPQLVDASLSATTNCRIDISSANGMANPFAIKRFSGKISVFSMHWRDDPRKDEAWYQKKKNELDPITLAQEIDIDYSASVEGVLIPSEWVQAAIDADEKLDISPSGVRKGALDVADEGKDENAFAGRHGVLLETVESWKGVGSDIFSTVEKAFMLCDDGGYLAFSYDADGLGAGVRGDARIINARRDESKQGQLEVSAFRGSGAVLKPDAMMVKGRKNKDFFANAKAQAWWALRIRFQNTYRAVVEGVMPEDPDNIIAISGKIPNLSKLTAELSQPTYSINTAGKIIIDKAPDNTKSPNLADSVMIAYAESGPMVKAKTEAKPKRTLNIGNSGGLGWMG